MKIKAIDGFYENQEIYLNEFQVNHLRKYHFITLLVKINSPKVEAFISEYNSETLIPNFQTVDYYLRLHTEFGYVLSSISSYGDL